MIDKIEKGHLASEFDEWLVTLYEDDENLNSVIYAQYGFSTLDDAQKAVRDVQELDKEMKYELFLHSRYNSKFNGKWWEPDSVYCNALYNIDSISPC